MKKIAIIGAGPSGLGCAYELLKPDTAKEYTVTIFDKNKQVGGLARTITRKGARFDVGPHRFYTHNAEVLQFWKQILGKEFRRIPRLTRILYGDTLFLYPIQLKDVVSKLKFTELIESVISYIYAKIFLTRQSAETFEDWITKNFGRKLYEIFFKTYTEKVWGIPCSQIGAEWATQRIKNLNFTEVIKTALFPKRQTRPKSLTDYFYYPALGSGQIYEKLALQLRRKGATIKLNAEVVKIHRRRNTIVSVDVRQNGSLKKVPVDMLFSSMPLNLFIQRLTPPPPKSVLASAKKLYFRDHITVNMSIEGTALFPDNWIYVHSPEVKMARISNYNNFSKKMSSSRETSSISVEYFAFQGDSLWRLSDKDIIKLATEEMKTVGLLKGKLRDAFVVRETESYPTYYVGHKKHFERIKKYVSQFSNFYTIGRGGMYRYNNMDHAIYSGFLAARNLNNKDKHNVWNINEDAIFVE